MLNPMVQSDLVTYRGVTIVILFLQATIGHILDPYDFGPYEMDHTICTFII